MQQRDLQVFRLEVRTWIDNALPREWRGAAFARAWPAGEGLGEDRSVEWHRRLYESGWAAPGWPVEYGGRGLDLWRQMVVAEELAGAGAPQPIGFSGIGTLGPALIRYGSDQQRRELLPRILSNEDMWCQGYSEPNAGSDLASMSTRAVRDGDDYVVTGQKVWTSYGRRANWCFLLVRTGDSESRHRGVTMLLARMSSPGIDWRPIRQMTGDRDFGELFLDEVRVPSAQRVGEEGDGWRIAMSSLAHERLMAGSVAPVRARLDALIEFVRNGHAVNPVNPVQRQKLAELECRLATATGVQQRAIEMAERDDPRFAAWSSMVKILSTELRKAVAELALQILGVGSTATDPYSYGASERPELNDDATLWAFELLDARAGPIYAGTSEILRNVVAETALGLPR